MKAPLSSKILHVEGLTKRYGHFLALNRCTLTIPAGTIFGLLGPNGAGKTTLIRCVLGFLKPTSGTASIHGFDCIHQSLEVRRRVGYLPAESKLFRLMRGRECLDFFTSIHTNGNLTRALQISKRLDLDLARRVAFMSTGMRQKLAIACVMGCPSPLMILDEPTANLDPSVRSVVLELVRETRNEGSTFAFCSHILSEIEELCDEVAILRHGSVVHTGHVASIRQIHRMKATMPRPIPREALPPGTKCLAMTDTDLLVDLPGTIDQYLDWIRVHGLTGVQMEMVGLKSLYEFHHQPASIPQDTKSG
jgi:ABC-2 type transport system ATP-binding protein